MATHSSILAWESQGWESRVGCCLWGHTESDMTERLNWTVFLHCWRITVVCLALKLVGSWVKLGFTLGMEAFAWVLVNSCSLESGVFWCSQVLDLSLLPLVFSLILRVASRLLHPYSTDDKTSRLMVKIFSIVRDTQRGSQSYMEKWRGMREIEVTRRRRGAIKRGESNIASNQFLMCTL